MRIIDLEQRSADWHLWRWQGITATESSAILGLNPHKSLWRLWCEKIGRAKPPELDANPLVRYGREHEDAARKLFEQRHCEVVLPACVEYDGNPVFRASLDGLMASGEPVELKCPSAATLADVRARGRDSDAYRLYCVQVQHQLLVTEAQKGWLVFYDGEASPEPELIEFVIERDEAVIASILKQGQTFWESVLNGKEPAKDPARDLFIPQTDEQISDWCRLAVDYNAASAQVEALQAQIASLNAIRNRCKEKLAAMMGEYRFADYAGVALTRRVAQGAVDCEAFCRDKGLDVNELAKYRKPAKESWLIRSTGSLVPKDFVDPDMQESITAIERSEPMWY
jgi:putative phage-type endonuclease